ncbi:MAG: hydrogenase maturation protease [Candidatus Thiodiazotropha sp. (ex Dulcina madagascariensis)]|nr:hydrogenase maturation protease [Candidatus Thiodiazotropha sp. (ex Dulcina madagascariensis)]
MTEAPPVLILGIGNLLWADEGFGVRALEALQRNYWLPEHVRLLDGGTQGYEAERPSEQYACRVGDARVLESDRFDLAYRPVLLEEDAIKVDVDAHLDKYRGKGAI